ncbi:MAG: hotdog fold domain-containing protein [Thiotrichaceae bacterium]
MHILGGFFLTEQLRYSNKQRPSKSGSTLGILGLWQRLNNLPLSSAGRPVGQGIFNFLIGKMVPYTGTVKPRVRHLEPGFVRVEMKDRRAVRNHLKSVHAIALANLGEFASGVAMLTALPDSVKAIVTHLEIDYKKKARGTLTAEGRAEPPEVITEDVESIVHAVIRDAENDVVAVVAVTWRLRSKDARSEAKLKAKDSPVPTSEATS